MTKMSKPDLGNGVSHPARFSLPLIPRFAAILGEHAITDRPAKVLDPFAGTGRIHLLRKHGFTTVGVEIEPEWASMDPNTVVGDATKLPFTAGAFDAIVTSPCYGNRMADHHEAKDKSVRRTYRHDLGRELSVNNAGAMQWGMEYRQLHFLAWLETWRVLATDAVFILNIKDHFRQGERQHVAGWHVSTLCEIGFQLLFHEQVQTRSMRAGSNSQLRFDEQIYVFKRKQGARHE